MAGLLVTLTSQQPVSYQSVPLIDLRERWASMAPGERARSFCDLPRADADDFFLSLRAKDQAELILAVSERERRLWIRILPPDDLADVIQEADHKERDGILAYLDEPTRKEVNALLAYEEDVAGGLMNPRFARVRPDITIDEAIKYMRKQARNVETLRYAYVLDAEQHLLGILSLRQMFSSDGNQLVRDVMRSAILTASDTMSQEDIKNMFAHSGGLISIPVVDAEGRMKGIITLDDIVEVVEEEATEDIQRLGGTEVLDAPYLDISLPAMIKKRAGWLIVLFVSEMLTATAMGYFEHEISRAVVLALFIPLIISGGGNSGSQASTLVVRALALKEVRLRDWWRVFSRELIVGTALGLILGTIGLIRILIWPTRETLYGKYYVQIGFTVGISVVGVVLWGSLSGSMLPFILRKLKLDPATASAPFVATLVDVSGLVIYFTVASVILKGTLL